MASRYVVTGEGGGLDVKLGRFPHTLSVTDCRIPGEPSKVCSVTSALLAVAVHALSRRGVFTCSCCGLGDSVPMGFGASRWDQNPAYSHTVRL